MVIIYSNFAKNFIPLGGLQSVAGYDIVIKKMPGHGWYHTGALPTQITK